MTFHRLLDRSTPESHYVVKSILMAGETQMEGTKHLVNKKIYALSITMLSVGSCVLVFYLNLLIPFRVALIVSIFIFAAALIFFGRKPRKFKGTFSGKMSIVISARDEEAVIEKTIRDLEKNDYPDFEIIIVNDGSADSTGDILIKLSKAFSNISIIDVPVNEKHGKVRALNMASRIVKGELMMILDADTQVDEHYLSLAVKPFSDASIGAVQTGKRIFNLKSLVPAIYDGDFAVTNIMMEYIISPRSFGSGFTIRTKYIKDIFPLQDSISDDQQMSNIIAKKGIKGVFNPTVVLYESAPLNFKTLLKQRRRWFLGSFTEMIRNNMMGFFWNTFFIFLLDISIISIFTSAFSLLEDLFIFTMLFTLVISIIHRKDFKILNPFTIWMSTFISYMLNVFICNIYIFVSIVKFGKDVKWFKTPREVLK